MTYAEKRLAYWQARYDAERENLFVIDSLQGEIAYGVRTLYSYCRAWGISEASRQIERGLTVYKKSGWFKKDNRAAARLSKIEHCIDYWWSKCPD